MSVEIILGDSKVDVYNLESESIDLMVTDPPYGVSSVEDTWEASNEIVRPRGAYETKKGFKTLPRNNPYEIYNYFLPIWKNCFDVLKPGAFAFIMASSRQDNMFEQLRCIKDSGFNISFTQMIWTYSSGFPKLNKIRSEQSELEGAYCGFNLKPAIENIIVAMKPLEESNYSRQAEINGKGITWINKCMMPETDDIDRYPANLIVSDEVLDEYSKYFDVDKWFGKHYPFINCPKVNNSERTGHPTQKPIKLFAYLIALASREGDVILDPFMGSGTSLIAAKMMGRNYIGVEKSDVYYKMCVERHEKCLKVVKSSKRR